MNYHTGKVSADGKAHFYNYDLFQEHLKQLAGKEFQLMLQEKFTKASTDQFGYYFASLEWVTRNSEQYAGNEVDDLDEYFSRKHLTYTKMIQIGKQRFEIKITESKSKLSKKRMAEFMTKVFADLALEGIYVPPPDNLVIGKYRTIKKKKTDTL